MKIRIAPPYYGNKEDKFILNIPDDTEDIVGYLEGKGIEFIGFEILQRSVKL